MLREKTLLAACLVLILTSINAQATLTSETVNGQNLVYDSGNYITWTQDANLLGSLEGAYQSTSYNNIVTAIINASGGVIHDTPNSFENGTYTLHAGDFGSGGKVDWWAGQAFVHYLDTINYGGSSLWVLPTQPDQNYGFNITNSQLGELFYNELGGTAGSPIPSGPFSNGQAYTYWSGTEYAAIPSGAWLFYSNNGYQDNHLKFTQVYVWAVSPGQVNAVPIPGAVWLFGAGLLGLLGLKQRGQAGRGAIGFFGCQGGQ